MSTEHVDPNESVDPYPWQHTEGEEIRAERPDWMTEERWQQVKVHAEGHIRVQVGQAWRDRENPDGRAPMHCRTRPWCTIDEHDQEHYDHHCGSMVRLDGAWFAYLTQDRPVSPPEAPVVVAINVDQPTSHAYTDVNVEHLAVIMAATSTPEARAALLELVNTGRV